MIYLYTNIQYSYNIAAITKFSCFRNTMSVKQTCSNFTKVLFFVACSVLSILSSLAIITTFFAGETTITSGFSHNGQKEDIKYHMPTFVLCPERPYKNNTQNKIFYTLEDYENNTIDPQLYLGDIYFMRFDDFKVC